MFRFSPCPPLALSAALVLALLVPPAGAFCGLASCPRPPARGEAAALEAGLRTRWVAYDIAGNEGSYVVSAPRFFVRYAGVALGAEAPFTRLDNGAAVVTGLSNPVLMIQHARRLSQTWSGEVGLQLELPVGDQENGLAGDHYMLLPWVGARRDFGPAWYAAGMFGFSEGFGGGGSAGDEDGTLPRRGAPLAKQAHAGHDHGSGAAPVLVNPHSDREVQFRAAVGRARGRAILEGFAIGQTDLSGGEPTAYLRAGASWEWALGRITAVQLIADAPVTSARRNELEIGLALKTGL